MNKKYTIAFFALLLIGVVIAITLFVKSGSVNIAVLNPKGLIALKESDLFVTATLLMLIIVVPVLVLTFAIIWKYRAGNTEAKYTPDWDNSITAECLWWGLPCLIILALSIITWTSTHELDPYKPLDVPTKPITIQVVALQWKWLFIYPEEKIVTVNFVQFPKETPINFQITADAPMNSFWIPQLGGQIYAMPGMKTKLHLIANEVGSFNGLSANLSGEGFAGMTFIAKASTRKDFETWVDTIKRSAIPLNLDGYNKLVEPSRANPEISYRLQEENLYDRIVMKYMMPEDGCKDAKCLED
ncbi:MAG: Ubiquinol oxidase subunit 2 [Chlamydiia bacterium]|nr:Ubiquinol oxidase subunit 2 [Chlamydiia bacterium]